MQQISHDEDSYSFDEFASKCDQLGLSPIHEEVASKTMPKCSESRDSGTVDDSYSADDDFDSPQEEIVGEYASSQDRDQSTDKASVDDDFDSPQKETVGEFRDQSIDKVEHTTPPVPSNTAVYRGDSQEGSQLQILTAKVEHDDENIGDIDTTIPLDANTKLVRPDVQSNFQEEKSSELLPITEAQTQEEQKVSLHHEHIPHTKRTASYVPRCAYSETKSMKLKKGALQSAEQKSAKLHRYSLERLSQLSKPVEHRAYHSDNGIDFKTANKPKKTPLDSSECVSSFLERMATKEEERREKLQRAVARAIYDAKVDKVCPTSF